MLRIDLDTRDYDIKIKLFREEIPNLIPDFVRTGADIIEDKLILNIKALAFKTGRLADSVQKTVNPDSADIFTTSGYGAHANYPTVAHKIRAKFAEFLRFEIDGKIFFRREVQHPGTKGAFYKEAAVREASDEIMQAIVHIYKSRTHSV